MTQPGLPLPPHRALDAQHARAAIPSITAVVPMLNEAENAGVLLLALRDALAAQSERFEIVVVNDGSRDATREVVLAAAPACHVRYIELSRNFGKEAALSAGLEAARGDVVLTLDGDFQHPISELPAMLARWREGYEMVYGVRAGRRDEGLAKRLGTAVFYGLLTRGSEVDIPPGAGDFRLMDRKVVDALLRLPERSRFMKGLYGWVGFRSIPFTYRVEPRAHGRSSFSMPRLVALAVAAITAFSYVPLRMIGAVGVLVSLAALGYGGWVIVETLVGGGAPPGYPTIVVSIMFFSGVQLLSLGVLGEYLGRVFEEVKQRPNFLVADDVSFSDLPARPPRAR